MDYALMILAILAAVALGWVGHWWTTRPAPSPPPPTPAERYTLAAHAVAAAYARVGQNPDAFTREVDLVPTGKLYEILHYAALDCGVDHELRTVGDVIDWLAEAPHQEPRA